MIVCKATAVIQMRQETAFHDLYKIGRCFCIQFECGSVFVELDLYGTHLLPGQPGLCILVEWGTALCRAPCFGVFQEYPGNYSMVSRTLASDSSMVAVVSSTFM